MKLLVINGPNINLLGIREPEIYGKETYNDLLNIIDNVAKKNNVEIDKFQSNWEGAIVDKIQQAYKVYDGIVINPAAYTHTSVAILDAIKAVNIPTVEIHISDVLNREEFRKISYIREVAVENFEGYGIKGYEMAIEYLINYLKSSSCGR